MTQITTPPAHNIAASLVTCLSGMAILAREVEAMQRPRRRKNRAP